MKAKFGRVRLLVIGLLLFALNLSAQTAGTGALTGTVTDASGGAITNATVTATNNATGQARVAMTGTDGSYKLSLLQPGNYRVKFEAPGFTTVEVPSVDVAVTETPVLDRSLAVGAQTQAVTVEGEVETIQTASSALGNVVAAHVVTDLPLSTRNYTNLLAMSAGTNADVNDATVLGKGWQITSVNGANNTQNNFQMDGAPIDNWGSFNVGNDSGFFASLPVPNPDAIQEFKIQTSNYDAGYGRNAGANVNVITKSGTNAFHGSAFEFFRNTALNANGFFNKLSEIAQGLPNKPGVLNQNQFGGTFGGPIKKDKLFFFVSYQETRQKNGISLYGFSTYNLPPIPGDPDRGSCPVGWTVATQCNLAAQTFIQHLGAANCPPNLVTGPGLTFQHPAGSVQVACDGSNINPVAINILQLKNANGSYYLPSPVTLGSALPAPGSFATFSSTDPAIYKEHQAIGNWDYLISSKETLSGRYMWSADPTTAPFACGITGTTAGCLPGAPVKFSYPDDAAVLRLTSIVSNNFVNEARASYQRFDSDSQNLTPFTNSQVGIQGYTPVINQLPFISVAGAFVIGAHNFFGLNLPENQMEFADQISWTHGKHSFRAGVEYGRNSMSLYVPSINIGQPTFNTFPDFLIGRCASVPGCALPNGNPGASNVASPGNTASFRAYNGQLWQTFQMNTINSFVQDDFKVTPRFTVNLGLRWEYDGFPKEKNGAWSDIWPSLINTVPNPGSGCVAGGFSFGAGAGGTGCSLAGYVAPANFQGALPAGVNQSPHSYLSQNGAPKDAFAPRAGFAWQPLADTHFVVRGGAGMFYEQPSGNIITLLGATPPYAYQPSPSPLGTLQSPFVIPPAAAAVVPGAPGSLGWPERWVNVTNGGASAIGSNLTFRSLQQDFNIGTIYEWNLNTQYEFLPTWVLELGYVGSHGINLPTAYPVTGATQSNNPPINLAQLASPTNPLDCGYDGVPTHCITQNTTGNVQARVPYLGFGPTFAPNSSANYYKFNSLQATLRKQLSHGLQLQAAYTYARSFISYFIGNPAATQPGIAPEIGVYGPNGAYRPQRLVIDYTWNIPSGNLKGVLGKAVSGWNWSGVTTIQNGYPLVITDTRSGTIFTGSGGGPVALATFCAGEGNSNIQASNALTYGLLQTKARPAGNMGYFNGGVFCTPPTVGGVVGGPTYWGLGAGLGNVLGPGQYNWDMALAKLIPIREAQTLQFRAEFFNTFNHPQFLNPGTNVALATFGQINGTSVNPRLIQFALKYTF